MESHITDFIGESESRQLESEQVFNAAVSELSERLATLESELEGKESNLQAMAADRSRLAEQLDDGEQTLNDLKTVHTQLVTENDGYRGQVARTEVEYKEALAKLHADAKDLAKEHVRERARVSDEHSAALTGQRKELVEATELSENRLMVLLDQERQAAKESTLQLANQLAEKSDKAQSNREKVIELEGITRELKRENCQLEGNLTEVTAQCSELSAAVEGQITQASSIQSKFDAYKDEYKISGDLGALQAAVATMQAKLEERQEE